MSLQLYSSFVPLSSLSAAAQRIINRKQPGYLWYLSSLIRTHSIILCLQNQMWNQLLQVETPHFVSKTLLVFFLIPFFKNVEWTHRNREKQENRRSNIIYQDPQPVHIHLPEAAVNSFIFNSLLQLEALSTSSQQTWVPIDSLARLVLLQLLMMG